MIPIHNIATILRDKGLPVRLNKTHGYIEDILFTGEYARFGKNPNLYYFAQDATKAAAFIEEGLANLRWTDEDWKQSLESEKDHLYFVCLMYREIIKKPKVSDEEARDIYFLFKGAIGILLSTYSERYKLPHGGLDLQCGKADGRCYRNTHLISLNTDLIMYNPNYIKSVILHELCHIAFPNHRRKFWTLLQNLLAEENLTQVDNYVLSELFARRNDYYITIPIIPGGPDMRYRNCLPHYDMFKDIKAKDK